MRFQQPQRAQHLRAFGQFLDADRGRANVARDANQRFIVQREWIDQRLRTMLANDGCQVQTAKVRIAAAARAKYASADCDRPDIVQRHPRQHQASASGCK